MNEHDHQVALFYWSRLMESQIPELALLYANPQNWGKQTPAQRRRMAAEGLRKGIPDITLPVARRGYHGLYLELKTEKGRLTAHQREWMYHLRKQGYCALMRRGWDDARRAILWYLEEAGDE